MMANKCCQNFLFILRGIMISVTHHVQMRHFFFAQHIFLYTFIQKNMLSYVTILYQVFSHSTCKLNLCSIAIFYYFTFIYLYLIKTSEAEPHCKGIPNIFYDQIGTVRCEYPSLCETDCVICVQQMFAINYMFWTNSDSQYPNTVLSQDWTRHLLYQKRESKF